MKTISCAVLAMSVGALSTSCGGDSHGAGTSSGRNNDDGGGSDSGSVIAAGRADPCKKAIDSGFAGDELCIEPPATDQGYQLHFGPSDYSDPKELAEYTLAPGAEEVKCVYDSVHTNPKPGTTPNSDGAHTGLLTLQAGDTISWECDVDNTTDQPLRFADLAYTAEMCNVFGFFTPGTGNEWSSLNP
jgi:hypothetical protein